MTVALAHIPCVTYMKVERHPRSFNLLDEIKANIDIEQITIDMHINRCVVMRAFPSMDVVQERRSIIKRNDTRGILFASMHRTSHGCVSRPPIRLMMMNVKSTLLVLLWSIQYHFQLDSDQ